MLESFLGKSPQIHPEAFVHEAAVLIGEVAVGAHASIWPNVTLRGDDGPIVIGEKTSIQDGTSVHSVEGLSRVTVGDRVTVGHNVMLHGCTIGDDSLIGIGSIILDNAVIEPGAFVAAGTLIPNNKVVKAGTMVRGNPFTVVRTLSERDRALIEFSWREYVTRAEQYLAARR